MKDPTALLPYGEEFEFWETEPIFDRVLHVDCHRGRDDAADGSPDAPYRTIQAAAMAAAPGTRVLIHAGTYRECVHPETGGESPERIVSYEAAGDGEVILSASEVVTQFGLCEEYSLARFGGMDIPVYQYEIDPDIFRGYNPFTAVNIIHERGWLHYDQVDMDDYLMRRGLVFVDGVRLKQVAAFRGLAEPGTYWVEQNGMLVNFRLPDGGSPEGHLIEMGCREQCFTPRKTGLAYIRLKGLTFQHACNGGPVPQVGAVSTRRGHHWIVEDCVIREINTVGLDMGNQGWSQVRPAEMTLGHSVVRRCRFSQCGVCGLTGFAATRMLVEDCYFEYTGWTHMEKAWESGAIKFHNSDHTLIRRNVFTHNDRVAGVWMDCENHTNRYTRNVFLDTVSFHGMMYLECNRLGENLVDNNIFWNARFYAPPDFTVARNSSHWNDPFDPAQPCGDAIEGDGTDDTRIVHNFIGNMDGYGYSQKVVQFRMYGGRGGTARNSTVCNNIFYDCRLAALRLPNHDNTLDGNAYVKMPAGFIRIVHPAPSECLDLPAARRFEGFEEHGMTAAFDITVDEDALTMTIKPAAPARGRVAVQPEVYGYGAMHKVTPEEGITTDFFGIKTEGERLPGPFASVTEGVTFSIDPRKV